MPKTTRCESDVDTRYGEKIEGGSLSEADMLGCRPVVKMTNIEGGRYEVNGELEKPIYNLFISESKAHGEN